MATLTTEQYGAIRQALFRKSFGKEELKALPALPAKAELLAAFQAVENNAQASRATIKTAVDGALGVVTSNALIKHLYTAYLAVRGT
jgi:hypothetical protein